MLALAAAAALLSAPPAAQRLPLAPRHLSAPVDASPPAQPVKLVFMHHSVGENWLQDFHGGLGTALAANNYFVSDTNYGWGPPDDAAGGVIGDHTDIGHWWSWFVGPHHATYLAALLAESGQHSDYSRPGSDPGGSNRIVMFKSCFPNSRLGGSPADPPTRTPPPMGGGSRLRRRLPRAGTPPAGPLCAPPHPPLVSDFAVRQVPPLAEPAPRIPFRDPVFGSCLVRVTERVADRTPDDRHGGLKNEYSRVQAFNADESRLLVRSTVGTWYLYDAATLRPLRRVEFTGEEPRWHPSDPQVFFFFQDAQLRAFDLVRGEDTLVHDFVSDFPGQTLSLVWTRWEGSPSLDGRWFGLMAQDESYEAVALLVYDRLVDRVTAVADLRGLPNPTPDSATISPSGTYLVAQFEYCDYGTLGTLGRPCGLMVYDRSLSRARGLARIIGHSDFAVDSQGREVLVYQDVDSDEVAMLDLATGARTALFPIDFSLASHGFHFSGRAFGRPGWVVVSTYSGGVPQSVSWLDDQVFLVELRAGGRVIRLAHTRSRVDENQAHDYWAEPQATANRDLTRILFTTNWGRSGTEEVETMLLELPPDWPQR